VTIVSLVRHGTYHLVGKGIGGRAPHPLNAEGLAQAGRVAEALSGRRIAALLSSPVRRTRETAAVIGGRLGLPVQDAPDFTEIDFADWTGRSFAELADQPSWRAWNRFRSTAAVPNGEAMLAVQARALAGLRRIALSWPNEEVVVVSHADIIKAVLAHVLGMPLDLLHRIEVAPASTSRIALYDEDAVVLGINLPA
jgi:ribonuclease H / adenosylcobalamin/alpha-ribazole phosphatase